MRNKLAGAGLKKQFHLSGPVVVQQTAEHLYRHFEKPKSEKKPLSCCTLERLYYKCSLIIVK